MTRGRFESSPVFIKLVVLGATLTVCAILGIFLSQVFLLFSGATGSVMELRILVLIQNSALFVLSSFLMAYWLWNEPFRVVFGLRIPHLSIIILGCLAILISSPMIDALNTFNQGLHLPESMRTIEQWMVDSEKEAEELTNRMLAISSWSELLMNLLVIAVLAGVGEELLFRGVLQRIFTRWSNNGHVGVWLAAIIFSAIHLQFFGFLPRVVLGALLGYLYLWSRNLWVPIIAHTLNNSMVIFFTPNEFNAESPLVKMANNMTYNSTWMIIGSAVIVSVCLFFIKRLSQEEKSELYDYSPRN